MAFVAAAPGAAYAQGYPSKTIRYVVPFPPGGITDMMARTIGQKVSDAWKQAIVVDNRAGGNALIGGELDFVITGLPECLPHIKSGRLRALAIASSARHPFIPEIQTTAELGMPSLTITSWTGLMVPSATPKAIVARINAEVAGVLKQPDTAAKVREQGFDIVANSAEAAQSFMAAEVERWGKLVREANIKAD